MNFIAWNLYYCYITNT